MLIRSSHTKFQQKAVDSTIVQWTTTATMEPNGDPVAKNEASQLLEKLILLLHIGRQYVPINLNPWALMLHKNAKSQQACSTHHPSAGNKVIKAAVDFLQFGY